MPTIEAAHRTSSSIVNMRSRIVCYLEVWETHKGSGVGLFMYRVIVSVSHEAPSTTEENLRTSPAFLVAVEIKFHFPCTIPVTRYVGVRDLPVFCWLPGLSPKRSENVARDIL